ncbi:histidine phosphatase family protein, partial [Candidatus Peregrinibacteria bacterium]|nr:histidine phosphatase family protein [Candidatus Peregrinibacteria bacterium]
MKESFEEKEMAELSPKLVIHVFRHDEKDTAQNDSLAPLTAKGRAGALAAGKTKEPKLNQGYVVCSPRDRALHSGLLQFFGPCLDVENIADKTLHELSDILSEKGHKDRVKTDYRLNFKVEDVAEFNDRFYSAYNAKEGNKTLQFQLDESDQLILDIAK